MQSPENHQADRGLGLVRSGLLGAGIFLFFFVYSLLFHGGFAVMGVADERLKIVTQIIKDNFLFELSFDFLRLLFLHLATGFVLGVWAGLIACGYAARFVLIAALHLLFYLRQIIQTPQLYSEFWLGRGGARKAIQIFLTDRLDPRIPAAVLLVFLAAAAIRMAILWPRHRRSIAAVAILGLLGAAGFSVLGHGRQSFLLRPFLGAARISQNAAGQKNVILLGLDSLRPDKLSGNGYTRNTTPNIDTLIPGSVFFTQIYTPLPRTFPAMVALLTGTNPPENGIRTMFPTFESRANVPPAVPKILAGAGYRTAVVSDFAGDIFPRIDLGFQDVIAPTFNILSLVQIRLTELMTHIFPYFNTGAGRKLLPILREFAQNADAEVLTDQAVAETDRLAREGKPFFLMVFYSTTHFPFCAPYPYYGLYADKNYDGPYRYQKYTLVGQKEVVTEADKAQVNALYDGTLTAADKQVGRYLRYLDKSGLAKNTILVLFGDHGEDLHELPDMPVQHGEQLRSEFCLKTPMLIFGPGIPAGRRIDDRVRAIDVAPTILELAGVRAPTGADRSLVSVFHGGPVVDRPIYAETGLWYDNKGGGFYQALRMPYPDVTRILEVDPFARYEMVIQKKWEKLTNMAKHHAWIRGGYKLIRMPMQDGVIDEFYDLNSDPECRRDLSAEHRPEQQAMARELDEYLSRVAPAEVFGDAREITAPPAVPEKEATP